MSVSDFGRRSMSQRQEEIAPLLPSHSFKEIGDNLGIAERTVKYHVDRMRMVFHASTVKELIRILQADGII